MSLRTLRWPDDQDSILDHIRQVYGPADHETWSASYGAAPDFDPANGFVIDGDAEGEIAAHAMIIPRQIQIGDSLLPAAEISLLGTLEAYQDRGYENVLLDVVHQRMTERGDVLGLSFGSPLLFEPWQYEYAVGLYLTSYESDIATDLALKANQWNPAHSYERRTADRLGVRRRDLPVRRFYINDLPTVQALYGAESARGHYLIARSDETWAWQLESLERTGHSDPDDFLVVEDEDRLIAYARLVSDRQVNAFRDTEAAHFSVIEAAGEDPDAIEALLAAIARLAQIKEVDRIGLFVHPDSRFVQHALVRGAALRHFTGAGFVRLHDLAGALELLIPTFESRLQNCRFVGRNCHLIVRTESDQAEILLGSADDPEVVEIDVPATVLVRLITGWFGFENVTAGYHERHTDLLRVLFPRRTPKIGLADLV
jgi:hypothetical protein